MSFVRWSLPVVGLLLAACTAQAVAPVAPAPGATRRPAAGPASVAPGSGLRPADEAPGTLEGARTLVGKVRAPAPIVTDNGAGLISDNGAIVLSNQGAKLISDHGAGVVGNHGASAVARYGLRQAPAQVPIAGARVALHDAAGAPLAGPDGAPLVAVTDARGDFAFAQALPPGPLVLSVELGGTAGQLVAIAPPAADARSADLDLVSTLTSTYILDRYVRPQADPAATLGKLPAAVEAETRVLAGGALAGGKVPLPTALTTSRVVATVDALRAAEPTLDAQLDAVKRLLIPAGQSDLGAGQLATSVNLGKVEGLFVGAGGELLLATSRVPAGGTAARQGRIWRLGADGRLAVAVRDDEPFVNAGEAGGPAQPAFRAFGLDAAGRPLIVGDKRLGRLEADGTVAPLGDHGGAGGPVRIGEAGTVWAVARSAPATDNRPATLRLVASGPGADARTRASSPRVPGGSPIALAADGRATVWDLVAHLRHSYDPAADAWTSAPEPAASGLWSVDPAGNAFVVDRTTRSVSRRDADGSLRPLIAALPPEVALTQLGDTIDIANLEFGTFSIAAAPDGAAYLVDFRNRVYRLAGGQATLVAGIAAASSASGDANAVSLEQPVALAALPGGDIVIADAGRQQLLRVTPDRKIAVWGGTGKTGLAQEGQAIAQAALSGIVRLLVDTRGDLWVFQQSLLSSAFAGASTPDPMTLLGATPAQLLRIGADGVVHVAAREALAFPVLNSATLAADVPHIWTAILGAQRLGADGLESLGIGQAAAGGTDDDNPGRGLVAGDAAGTLWLVPRAGTLAACLPPAAPEVVSTDARVASLTDATGGVGHGVVDAQGRLCFGDPQRGCVWRFDRKDASFTALAGQGGRIFAGSTPDDSIGSPRDLCFAPDGALLVLDGASKQVKRVPPDKL